MSLDAALCFQPGRGWYLAPSPDLETTVRQQQTPPPFPSGGHHDRRR